MNISIPRYVLETRQTEEHHLDNINIVEVVWNTNFNQQTDSLSAQYCLKYTSLNFIGLKNNE